MGMENHDQIRDYINALEARYPVDKWLLNNIHIWPYIRIKIYYHLIHVVEGESTFSKEENSKVISKNLFSKIYERIVNIVWLVSRYVGLKKSEILFFSIKMHRVHHLNVWFNRFFDSMISAHNLEKDVLTIEMEGMMTPSYNSKQILDGSRLVQGIKVLVALKKRLTSSRSVNESDSLEGFKVFKSHLRDQQWFGPAIDFQEDHLRIWSNKIYSWSRFYRKIFKKTGVKKLIFLSYYGFDTMAAAIYAGNEMGLKTIDFQHGPQTNVHMAYSRWDKVPEKGYNTMPTSYWTWDKVSRDNILHWLKKDVNVVEVGQPWLGFLTQNIESQKTKKQVLYSLQVFDQSNLDYYFSQNVVAAMIAGTFRWVLRLHPRNFENVQILIDFLTQAKVPAIAYKIENSKEVPLPLSLKESTLHMTNYSGCLIEARLLGIPSLIIDQIGHSMYSDYIDDRLVFYVHKSYINFIKDFNHIFYTATRTEKTYSHQIFNPVKETF